jgi:flagella basal body P-ring formation protein FlgA
MIGGLTILFTMFSPAKADVVESMRAAIQLHVAERTGRALDDVEVAELLFDAPHSCEGGVEVQVESNPSERFRGQTQFRIRLVDGARLCGRFGVPARVTLWQLAPVASQDLNTGEPIAYKMARVRQGDLRSQLVDLASQDWVAARAIRMGQPITQRMAKRRPAVSTGDRVSIVAEYGPLTVKAEGRMLAQAYIGDRVRVSNVATDTVVQGILIAPGLVRAGGR